MSQLEAIADEKPRSGRGTFLRTPDQIALDHRAAELRAQSKTFREIGELLDVPLNTAYNMVQRAIADIPREATVELVALEVAKLDTIERRSLEILNKRHVHVSASGRVATLDGAVIEDDGPIMQALNVLLKVSDRRARLLGLNAPSRTELTGVNGGPIEIQATGMDVFNILVAVKELE